MSEILLKNKKEWDELAQLVKRAQKSVRRLSPEELHRLDVLYRRVTVHLAQVSSRTRDAALVQHLNNLAAAAHSVIYVAPRPGFLKTTGSFLTDGFARSVARTWRHHALAIALLIFGVMIAYTAVRHDPVAAYALLPPGEVRQPGASREQLESVLRSGRDSEGGEKFMFASFLFSNNFRVGLLALATGVLAGVPTIFLIIYNGMILGAFLAVYHASGVHAEVWAWLAPHGITELGAIALCGGIGLLLGRAVVSPGMLTRAESLRLAGIEAGKIILGVAVMLFMAAIIESYLRQSHLPIEARFGFAIGSLLFWIAYFVRGALLERRAKSIPRENSDHVRLA